MTLANGTVIDVDKARVFADYYCKRFGFGKPETTFEQASAGHQRRKGPVKQQWEAIMSVSHGGGAGCTQALTTYDVADWRTPHRHGRCVDEEGGAGEELS